MTVAIVANSEFALATEFACDINACRHVANVPVFSVHLWTTMQGTGPAIGVEKRIPSWSIGAQEFLATTGDMATCLESTQLFCPRIEIAIGDNWRQILDRYGSDSRHKSQCLCPEPR